MFLSGGITMAKSKRVLGIVLAVIMVLTMIPAGMIGAYATSTDNGDGGLVFPTVTLNSTPVIRVAQSTGSTTPKEALLPGTTIVPATNSGLAQISQGYPAAYYAGETPAWPQIVFTSD